MQGMIHHPSVLVVIPSCTYSEFVKHAIVDDFTKKEVFITAVYTGGHSRFDRRVILDIYNTQLQNLAKFDISTHQYFSSTTNSPLLTFWPHMVDLWLF